MRRATCPGPYRPGRQAELASAYGAFGLVLMATNYGDAANASLLHAQALAPDDMRWPYYLGQLHTLIGDGTRATEFFERAVDLQPTNVATLVSLGRAYLDQGRPEAAERLFDQALLLEPSSGAVLAGMGRAALAQRDYRGAVEPRASSLRYPLAMAHRALGNVETAERHLRLRGEGEPTLVDPLMLEFVDVLGGVVPLKRRGVDALNAGRLDAAAGAFRAAIALEPDNPELRQWLSTTLFTAGDIPGAVEQLEETLRRAPAFPNAHFGLGSILMSDGRYEEAVDRFSAAVAADSAYLEARVGLAQALRAAGRLEESLPHYKRAVSSDPRVVGAWVGGAVALVELERHDEARDWLARAMNLYPNRRDLAALAERVRADTTSGR